MLLIGFYTFSVVVVFCIGVTSLVKPQPPLDDLHEVKLIENNKTAITKTTFFISVIFKFWDFINYLTLI